MANITARKDVHAQPGFDLSFPVAASTTLYEGAAVSLNASGYLTNSADTASTKFVGVLETTVDNSAGANGDKRGIVRMSGVVDFVAGFAAVAADCGAKVYASDNQTVLKTSTNSILVGRIVEVVSASKVRVFITPEV